MSASRVLKELAADRVVRILEPGLPPGRSSAYLASRHAALYRRRYQRALETRGGDPSAEELAAEARVLGFLGREGESRRAYSAALARDSGCAAAWAWRWDADFAARGNRSFADIDRAVMLEPGRALWRALRGIGAAADFLGGRMETGGAALVDIDKALDLDSRCPPALVCAGLILSKTGRNREALSFIDRALRESPRAAFLYKIRSLCHLSIGDRDAYVADCEKGIYLSESLGYFHLAMGRDGSGGGKKQVEAATRFLRGHPRAYWMYACRGDCRRSPDVNDHPGGLRDLEKAVELKPDCAYAWAYLSRARLSHSGQAAAIAAADRAVELRRDCGWLWIWRGEIKRRLGDVNGALADLNRGLDLDADYELGYAWRGGAKRSLGRLEEALDDLSLSIALDSKTAWAFQERSLTLRQLGRTSEALKDLEAAHRADPKFVWCAQRERSAAAIAELNLEIERSPKLAWAWAWRGETKLQAGNSRGALVDLNRALELDPRLGWPRAWRARAYQRLGRPRRALRDLNRAVSLEPLDAHARAWRGRVRHLLADPKGALADLKRAVELDRKSSWIYLWKGEVEEDKGLLAAAAQSYDQALSIDRRHVAAMVARGRLRARRGDTGGAWSDVQGACAASPNDAQANYWRGVLNQRSGRWGEAHADYARALADAGRLTKQERLAARRFIKKGAATAAGIARALEATRRLAKFGRHSDAAANCDEILRVAPDCTQALRLRSEAHRCLGEYHEMVSDLDSALKFAPNDPSAWLSRGTGRRNACDFSGALDDAARALRLSPKSADAQILKSEALRNLGRFREAVEAAGRAVAAQPARGWAYVVRGKALRQAGDPPAALADFKTAIRLDPKDAKARGWSADALMKLGRLKEAASAARAAVTLQPTCAWAVALEGEIERRLGRRTSGFNLIRQAVALDPNGSCAHDFLGADPPEVWEDPCYAWVFAWRGAVLRGRKDWTAARRDLEHAVCLDPGCFWARGWLGELKLVLGDAAGALRELSRTLEEFHGDADVWIWRGRALGELNRWKSALGSFRKALELAPENPWAMVGCSVSLERLGRGGAAVACMARARKTAPALFAATGAPR